MRFRAFAGRGTVKGSHDIRVGLDRIGWVEIGKRLWSIFNQRTGAACRRGNLSVYVHVGSCKVMYGTLDMTNIPRLLSGEYQSREEVVGSVDDVDARVRLFGFRALAVALLFWAHPARHELSFDPV